MTSAGLWIGSGLLDPIPFRVRSVGLVGGLVLICILSRGRSKRVGRLKLPQSQRQIAQEVLGRGFRGVFRFGFEIGTGVRTYLPTAAPHALALGLLLTSPTVYTALGMGAAFGIGRGLQQLATAIARSRDSFQEGWQRPVVAASRFATVATAVGVAGFLL